MAFVHVKGLVDELLKKFCVNGDSLAVYRICENELGNLARRVQVAGKKDYTLFLRVDNPVYIQELRARRRELIRKINGSFGNEVVREIRIIN
jgi:hypothetical protein